MSYQYAGAELLSTMPTETLVKTKHPAGICASYTCDYIKKCLDPRKAPINLTTYETAKRVNKMISRQQSYESQRCWGGKGVLDSLFDAYKIERDSGRNYVNESFAGWTDTAGIDAMVNGIYYIAFEFTKGGHAIAYNIDNRCVADANAGIYQYPELTWAPVRETVLGQLVKAGELTRIMVIKCRMKS